MVRRDGVTKVVDFGIARASSNQGSRTATGVVRGKLSYMSPEQLGGQAVGGRSDQFALGIVLWELLTEKRLFKAQSDPEVMKLVLSFFGPASLEPGRWDSARPRRRGDEDAVARPQSALRNLR